MAALAPALPYISAAASIGGTILQAVSARNAGIAEKYASEHEAQQADILAGQEEASAQRVAAEEQRRKRLALSSLQARAAASGAGATDPTVLDIAGDIEEEGEYRAATAMYEGAERSRVLRSGADLSRFEGRQAKRAGNITAAATILSGGTSLIDKYDQRRTNKKKYQPGVSPRQYLSDGSYIDWNTYK